MKRTAPDTALQKRIKRHLIGRDHRFFAATAPGLEMLCRDELKSLLPGAALIEIGEGGVEFEGRLHDCYLANLHLHAANRVLMRIGSFHAAHFSQLEKNLNEIPWELYLEPGSMIQIQATLRKSRLYHKDAVAERVQAGIAFHFQSEKSTPASATAGDIQQVFVRAVQNEFTLSIDSSGELLHKRGIKPFSAKAPLRETIAAAALMLAGYTGSEPLIDPMCGSGSFSLEAALMAQRIPPGWYREFAFMGWPSFQAGRWRHIRREAEMQMTSLHAPVIFSSDLDEQTVKSLNASLSRQGLTGAVAASVRDFFEFSPKDLTDKKGLVVLNPPFGRRLGSPQQSDELFAAICRHLKTEYRGWKLALVAPGPAAAARVPLQLAAHPLPLGGIKIVLLTGKIP